MRRAVARLSPTRAATSLSVREGASSPKVLITDRPRARDWMYSSAAGTGGREGALLRRKGPRGAIVLSRCGSPSAGDRGYALASRTIVRNADKTDIACRAVRLAARRDCR